MIGFLGLQNKFYVFLILLVSYFISGCLGSDEVYDGDLDVFEGCSKLPGFPFGNHRQSYTKGAILPDISQKEMDVAVKRVYDNWKKQYLTSGSPCKKGHYWVKTDMDDSATVSEAHGFGMIIVVYMAGYDKKAKTVFDGMYHYFRAHPSSRSNDLMAWAQDYKCKDAEGADSAADGDLDIAYALLLADRQWGSAGDINYRKEARKVIRAIMSNEVYDSRYMMLGDWVGSSQKYTDSTRLSDFMPGHMESFAADNVSGLEGDWIDVRDGTYDIIKRVAHSKTGLVPDFVVGTMGSSPEPAPPGFLEGDEDGMYGYNSCRVPFRVGVNYVLSGNKSAKKFLTKFMDWALIETGGDPSEFVAGYRLDGTPNSDYDTLAFTAPLAVGAMTDKKYQKFLNKLWDYVSEPEHKWSGYYSDTIQMLSLLVLSNNWWAPQDAVCVMK